MANYTFKATLDGYFIRKIEVTAYAIKRAKQEAVYELKKLYPSTYHNLEITLIHCNVSSVKIEQEI